MIDKTATTQRSKLHIENANKFANKMNKLHNFFCKKMRYIQAIQEDYAKRKRISAPNYKVGDSIFVDAKNLCSKWPSKKLDFKSNGLYFINKIIGLYAYWPSLLPNSNADPIFHINKLCLAPDNFLPGQHFTPLPLLRVSNITDK